MAKKRQGWMAGGIVVSCTAVCALLIGLMLRFGAREHVLQLMEWLRGIDIWGPVLFILIEIAVVIFLLPGILFTMGAGFLFGPVLGTVYVVTGHTIGGALAFLIARKFFGRRAVEFLKKRQGMRDLDLYLSEQGWRTILLTRMVPFFPFKLSNYCFGVMHFSLRDFIIGSAIGMIPIAATNVYAGSLAADLATMTSAAERGPLEWAVYGLGLAALLFLVLFLGKAAHSQLNTKREGKK
jgi:uncharacterized membrane protein YdjX (TVP38/TMEM64 family)